MAANKQQSKTKPTVSNEIAGNRLNKREQESNENYLEGVRMVKIADAQARSIRPRKVLV